MLFDILQELYFNIKNLFSYLKTDNTKSERVKLPAVYYLETAEDLKRVFRRRARLYSASSEARNG